MKNVVVIGGGSGQSVILKGLKQVADINITTIVTVADDGGSTGRLRRQFHIPAMGDIR
ncbi:2-phospho-L-lactate transferase CofD family protein, partial [Traorella massiliensis]